MKERITHLAIAFGGLDKMDVRVIGEAIAGAIKNREINPYANGINRESHEAATVWAELMDRYDSIDGMAYSIADTVRERLEILDGWK